MKILIAGSRSIRSFELDKYIPENTECIISGGAEGIDALAEEYADKKKIEKLILRPNYDIYGRAAPIKRSYDMVDIADKIIIIWDGKSNGTRRTIQYAKRRGKDLTVITVPENDL